MSQEILDKSLCLSIHNLYCLYELLCHIKICSIQKEDTLFVTFYISKNSVNRYILWQV